MLVIAVTIALLGTNWITVALAVVATQVGNTVQPISRLLICVFLIIMMYFGRSWARWLVVVFYSASGLGAVLTAFRYFPGRASVFLLAVGCVYFVSVLVLALSPAVRMFLAYRRRGLVLTADPDGL